MTAVATMTDAAILDAIPTVRAVLGGPRPPADWVWVRYDDLMHACTVRGLTPPHSPVWCSFRGCEECDRIADEGAAAFRAECVELHAAGLIDDVQDYIDSL